MFAARAVLCLSLLTVCSAPTFAYGDGCSREEMAMFGPQPHTTIMPAQRKAPKYPLKAELSYVEGWVDVLLTVETDGRVSKACVLRANPQGWFEAETMKVVTEWQYSPSDVAALPDRRLKIRMSFMLK